MDPYLTVKWIHILSSTVLFGTGIGTAFQMVWALHGNDPRVISRVSAGVVVADWIFTTPAGLVQPITGVWLVFAAGYDPWSRWLMVVYALYLTAFVCWVPVVRLQIRIRDLARDAAISGTPLPAEVRRAYRIWFALGWPAFIALTATFWLMVAKPQLTL